MFLGKAFLKTESLRCLMLENLTNPGISDTILFSQKVLTKNFQTNCRVFTVSMVGIGLESEEI